MQKSLSSLMNAMINRLEYTQAEELGDVPENKYWQYIHIYIKVDDILAYLYKQYCDRKNDLSKLLVEKGANDPMTEIALDMHDSARSMIDARLIELKSDEVFSKRVEQLKSLQNNCKIKSKIKNTPIEQTIAFLMMVNMITKYQSKQQDVRRDFAKAS